MRASSAILYFHIGNSITVLSIMVTTLCVDFAIRQALNWASGPAFRAEIIPEAAMQANIGIVVASSDAHNAVGFVAFRLAKSLAALLAGAPLVAVFALNAPGPALAACMSSASVHTSAGVHGPATANAGVHTGVSSAPASSAAVVTGCPVATTAAATHMSGAGARLSAASAGPRRPMRVSTLTQAKSLTVGQSNRPSRHRP